MEQEHVYEFIANTTDGVVVVDRSQRIVLWNDGARELLGFAAEETVDRHCYEVFGGTDEKGCPICRAGCMATRAAGRGELVPTRTYEVYTASGDPRRVSVTTVLLPSRWREFSLLAHLFRPDLGREATLDEFRTGWLGRALQREVPHGDRPAARVRVERQSVENLTPREREVLRLLSTGSSTDAMMVRLGVARTTVRTHVRRLLDKLGVHSRLEAVALGMHRGHLGPGSVGRPADRDRRAGTTATT